MSILEKVALIKFESEGGQQQAMGCRCQNPHVEGVRMGARKSREQKELVKGLSAEPEQPRTQQPYDEKGVPVHQHYQQ